MSTTSLAFAFLAGLASFLSPCVLPLIPGYLAFLAGTTLSEANRHRASVFFTSVFFVLGFSVIFAIIGVLLNSVLGQFAYSAQTWLSRTGGLVIIFFGLYLTGLIRISWLEQEHKFHPTRRFSSRYLTAFVFGAAFAAGWTPCVGAVLGGILTLAATQPGSAFTLLMSYSLGLGLPFLVVGLFASSAQKLMSRLGRSLHVINAIFGVLLIIVGILIFTEMLSILANFSLVVPLLLRL